MFFNTFGNHDQNIFAVNKRESGNMPVVNNNISSLEINKEMIGLPLNIISAAYPGMSPRNDQVDNKESKTGLYRPISPISDEQQFTLYGYRNSTSPGQERNGIVETNYSHSNDPTLMFEKYPHIAREIFDSSNNFHHPQATDNAYQYSYNNNNYRHHNNNYGHHGKSRSNHQNNANNNSNNRDQRRRPLNSYYRYNPDVMIRRAHGLTHRFKSRSDIMKIDPSPSQLLNGSSYDHLSQAIYDIFIGKAQKTDTYENKIQLWKDLFLYIRRCVSHYALYIVGSTMTGFGLDTSDIDMCLLIRPWTEDPRLDSLHQLHHIRNHLLKYGVIVDSELILAKVPILKFRENSTGFEIDLNCNNGVGIYNTHLLYCYARCDWRVRPLVVMVKFWAQANRINDAKNMTVSSYSWTLMVIHYLQCGLSPLVLPCLHTLYPEHFNSDKSKITDVHEDLQSLDEFQSFNVQSLAELFIGFFGYYANFDFNQYAISVRAGGRLLIEDCKLVKAPKNDQNQWKYMCIEEPFDFTNTARSVYDVAAFRHIKTLLSKSYEELVRTKVLNSVLPVIFDADTPVVAY